MGSLREDLVDSVVETMQSLAFVDLIEDDPSNFDIGGDYFSLKIDILLPYLGDVWLFLDKRLSHAISQNLFQDSSDQMIQDASSEFLNIFVGLFLQKHLPKELFELGIPSVNTQLDIENYDLISFVSEEGFKVMIAHKMKANS